MYYIIYTKVMKRWKLLISFTDLVFLQFFIYFFTLSTNNVMQISISYKMRNTGHPTLDQHNICQCQGYLNMRSNTKLQYSSCLSSVSISALYLSVKVIIVESTVQGFSHEVILYPESGHNHLL